MEFEMLHRLICRSNLPLLLVENYSRNTAACFDETKSQTICRQRWLTVENNLASLF
jgi:hypothetical protein